MITSTFYLCAVPEAFWNVENQSLGFDLLELVSEALSCERRIIKKVNLENEYERYTLICQRLEQQLICTNRFVHIKELESEIDFESAIQCQKIPIYKLPAGYIGLLKQLVGNEADIRLGKNFYPPEEISHHLQKFIQLVKSKGYMDENMVAYRIAFYQLAARNHCGVIELQSGFHFEKVENTTQIVVNDVEGENHKEHIDIPEYVASGFEIEFLGSDSKIRMADRLREQIYYALANDEPIAFGNQAPHDVFTEVLHECVFVPPDQPLQSATIQVIYADGSQAMPFPLFCLHQKTLGDISNTPLRTALMSMRHLEMDPEIDFCWFRNREVSQSRSLAETDQFCYDKTIQQLADSLMYGPMKLHMFHTGFEPAVIGFYRGVVHMLLQNKGQNLLQVSPFYYRGESGYQKGKTWA